MNWLKQKKAQMLLSLRPALLASLVKKFVLPHRETIKTQDGIFWIDVASNFGYRLFKTGIYEPYLVSTLQKYLSPGGVFIDLGANEGYFSVIASKLVGTTGKVVAIEPQARLQYIIHKNLTLNHCNNVQILPVAVSDKSEKASLNLSPDMNTGASSLSRSTLYPLPKQEVELVTLTKIFEQENITSCDLIKIDIEGWEYEAIMGSLELLRDHRIKAISLELHPQVLSKRGLSADVITRHLSQLSYSLDRSLNNTVFVNQI